MLLFNILKPKPVTIPIPAGYKEDIKEIPECYYKLLDNRIETLTQDELMEIVKEDGEAVRIVMYNKKEAERLLTLDICKVAVETGIRRKIKIKNVNTYISSPKDIVPFVPKKWQKLCEYKKKDI